jgi:hypothetical protein
MDYGPVPSDLYDDLKSLKKGESVNLDYNDFLKVEGNHYLVAFNLVVDFDVLSDSDKEMLSLSANEHKTLNYQERTDRSHDSAWEIAYNSDRIQRKMDVVEIAQAGGADEFMIEYIKESLENESLLT